MQRVLIVEDEKSLVVCIVEALEGLAHISVAYTIEEAMELVGKDKEPYDVVICDKTLPDGKSFEFVSFLGSVSPQTSVIFLSGDSDLDDKLKGFGMDADDYLDKPIPMRELRQRIRRALERQSEKK